MRWWQLSILFFLFLLLPVALPAQDDDAAMADVPALSGQTEATAGEDGEEKPAKTARLKKESAGSIEATSEVQISDGSLENSLNAGTGEVAPAKPVRAQRPARPARKPAAVKPKPKPRPRPQPVPVRVADEDEEDEETQVVTPIWMNPLYQAAGGGLLLLLGLLVLVKRKKKTTATVIEESEESDETTEEGDDDKPAVEEVSEEGTEESSHEAGTPVIEKPARKGLFSWLKRKKKPVITESNPESEEVVDIVSAEDPAGSVTVAQSAPAVEKKAGKPSGTSRTVKAIEGLIEALALDDGLVAKHATMALIQIGEPAIPYLINALNRPESKLRMFATGALARIGAPALEALLPCLKHKDPEVRLHACMALGMLGDARVAKALQPLLKDPDERVKQQTAKALQRLQG